MATTTFSFWPFVCIAFWCIHATFDLGSSINFLLNDFNTNGHSEFLFQSEQLTPKNMTCSIYV